MNENIVLPNRLKAIIMENYLTNGLKLTTISQINTYIKNKYPETEKNKKSKYSNQGIALANLGFKSYIESIIGKEIKIDEIKDYVNIILSIIEEKNKVKLTNKYEKTFHEYMLRTLSEYLPLGTDAKIEWSDYSLAYIQNVKFKLEDYMTSVLPNERDRAIYSIMDLLSRYKSSQDVGIAFSETLTGKVNTPTLKKLNKKISKIVKKRDEGKLSLSSAICPIAIINEDIGIGVGVVDKDLEAKGPEFLKYSYHTNSLKTAIIHLLSSPSNSPYMRLDAVDINKPDEALIISLILLHAYSIIMNMQIRDIVNCYIPVYDLLKTKETTFVKINDKAYYMLQDDLVFILEEDVLARLYSERKHLSVKNNSIYVGDILLWKYLFAGLYEPADGMQNNLLSANRKR